MALQQKGMHGTWTSRWTFIMAATGSAVGLGNMWKFPYVAGSNGGGAFVLIYLGCILLIGVPVMMSEVLIGRNGRQSPINSMNEAVTHSNANALWRSVGWLGVLAGLLILSFYAVIAGWALDYIFLISSGELSLRPLHLTLFYLIPVDLSFGKPSSCASVLPWWWVVLKKALALR